VVWECFFAFLEVFFRWSGRHLAASLQDGGFSFGIYMKLSGWIFMIFSWMMILGMFIFCFSRIFRKGLGGEDSKALKRLKK